MNSVWEIVRRESILMQCGFQALKKPSRDTNEGVGIFTSMVHVNI